MRGFFSDENGNMTVSFSLITPFIIFYFLWVVSTWQAMYIQMQTKAVIDIALLGGATTGVAIKQGNTASAGSYIPIVGGEYGAYNEYGSDVATNLIRDNAYSTLPKSLADQLVKQTKGYWQDATEINYQLGGIMHFKAENIKYRSLVPVLFSNWNFTIESTARCQPK